MKNKLYTELNRYNVFDIGGYQCSNGYRSALVSKDLMFKHGNFGFITPTIGCKGGSGDPDCIVDFTNDDGKFTLHWKGGQVCEIVARKVELPQGIPEDELENLADIRLVDERHSYIYDDGSAWLALDLDRIIGNKWHRKLLGSLKAYADKQVGMVVGRPAQVRRIEPVILTGTMELALVDIYKNEVISDSMKIDISSLSQYVADLVKKCKQVYGM